MTIIAPVDGDFLDPAWAVAVSDAINSLLVLSNAWSTYTPVWSSSGTQPVLGNGTITGRYQQTGKTAMAYGKLTIGSTTTFGTGSYRVSVPIAASSTDNAPGPLWIFDSGTASRSGTSFWVTTTTLWLTAAASGDITATNPQTFAINDIIAWFAMYETP